MGTTIIKREPGRRQDKRSVMKNALKLGLLYTRNKTYVTKKSEPPPLTGQHDYKTDYYKRRISKRNRYKYKRRRRARRRVISTVRNYFYGAVHIVRRSAEQLFSGLNQSQFMNFGLNGLDGQTNENYNTTNDIGECLKEKDAVAWNQYDNNLLFSNLRMHQLHVLHATLEITVRNIGVNDVILEAYYIQGKQPLRNTQSLSPTDLYSSGFNRMAVAQDPDTGNLYDLKLQATQVGVTPFQNALFCRHYTVYKRTKFNLPIGGEINLILTNSRSYSFKISDTKGMTTDRRYRGILMQFQGAPIATGETFQYAPISRVCWTAVRRYRMKFIPDKEATGAFETTD